jgi:hypothetical protein
MSGGPHYRRPLSVLIAQILFWAVGVLVLVIEAVIVMRKGAWDWPSCATATLSLLAGILGLARPRARFTYFMGGIALIALAARAGLAAWDLVRHQQHDMRSPQLAPYPGIIAILLAWLMLVHFFGKASRAYFSIK